MPLTLGNNLTNLVSREVNADSSKARGLGQSLTTGNDVFTEVVDSFIGGSLEDKGIILAAVAKNTAYSTHMLTVADEYLKTITSSLQDALKIATGAGLVSVDKLAVLQQNFNDKKSQIDLLIKNADFDNKNLLQGDAQNIQVQVGLNPTDRLRIHINDFSNGKLFRSSITKAFNNAILDDPTLADNYYANAAEVNAAFDKNINLIYSAIARPAANIGGGTNNVNFTNLKMANLIFALSPRQKAILDQLCPISSSELIANGGGFVNATTAAQIANVYRGPGPAFGNLPPGDPKFVELLAILRDNNATNVSIGNKAAVALTQDVFQNALNTVRIEQASLANQKTNLIATSDALRVVTNVTQAAADSYLKTDYVLTAQEYSQTLRSMVAAITSLQAANKVPEAAQRLIDGLAK
jgi:hypothetical protein